MKTIKKVPIKLVYTEYGKMPEFSDMEDGILYVSKKGGIGIHRCLCGCGEKCVTPFTKITTENEEFLSSMPGQDWFLSIRSDKATITPSIGNYEFPCKSHYIITNGIANFV
jgi:hypothetical protein